MTNEPMNTLAPSLPVALFTKLSNGHTTASLYKLLCLLLYTIDYKLHVLCNPRSLADDSV